jgi:phosphate transport system substrate-binding protein
MTRFKTPLGALVISIAMSGLFVADSTPPRSTIRVQGSDTMADLLRALKEPFIDLHPEIEVNVQGGGSGVGAAFLFEGKCDVASMSRLLTEGELERFEKKLGQKPIQLRAAIYGLAVIVHKDNPLARISLEELKELYIERGKISSWSQLEVKVPGVENDKVALVGRLTTGGVYSYFRERVLGEKGTYRTNILEELFFKDVVKQVASNPLAIGYCRIADVTEGVRAVPLTEKKSGEAVPCTPEDIQSGKYPLSRVHFLYVRKVPGKPLEPSLEAYLRFVLSAEGAEVVRKAGWIPLPPAVLEDELRKLRS